MNAFVFRDMYRIVGLYRDMYHIVAYLYRYTAMYVYELCNNYFNISCLVSV